MEQRKTDYYILISTLLLICVGCMTVYSASAILSNEKYHDSYYFLKREIIFCLIAIGCMITMMRIDYHKLWKVVYPFMGLTLFFCVLVAIPGIGIKAGGARRWLGIGGFTFQPSEMVKLSLILFMAYSLAKKREKMESFTVGVLPHLLVAGLMMGLILLQKDLGTTFTLAVVLMVLLFVGGTKISYLAGAILAAIPALYFLVFSVDYRRQRIMAFLDPWTHMGDSGFQIIQSYVGFNNGGIWGLGLGQGRQKLFYLPAAHTDFILSVVGEELGLFGVLFVLTLFVILIVRGFRTALKAPDLFGMYLALGIVSLISVQSLINFGVVMGLLPTKGLPLPFISYGGTSVIIMSMCIGIVLNIASQAGTRDPAVETALPTQQDGRKVMFR
ncbi:MAG: putative lipid II flippase FtsW [Deltaproteobacteria bacterium]|nr:putative lipid II flippase FtsW [Deltaproteobacteria bacterium]